MVDYLNIENEQIRKDFLEMSFLSVHVEKCHPEDYETVERDLEHYRKNVLNHYNEFVKKEKRIPMKFVLINTFRRIWMSNSDYINSYNMWAAVRHNLKLE